MRWLLLSLAFSGAAAAELVVCADRAANLTNADTGIEVYGELDTSDPMVIIYGQHGSDDPVEICRSNAYLNDEAPEWDLCCAVSADTTVYLVVNDADAASDLMPWVFSEGDVLGYTARVNVDSIYDEQKWMPLYLDPPRQLTPPNTSSATLPPPQLAGGAVQTRVLHTSADASLAGLALEYTSCTTDCPALPLVAVANGQTSAPGCDDIDDDDGVRPASCAANASGFAPAVLEYEATVARGVSGVYLTATPGTDFQELKVRVCLPAALRRRHLVAQPAAEEGAVSAGAAAPSGRAASPAGPQRRRRLQGRRAAGGEAEAAEAAEECTFYEGRQPPLAYACECNEYALQPLEPEEAGGAWREGRGERRRAARTCRRRAARAAARCIA